MDGKRARTSLANRISTESVCKCAGTYGSGRRVYCQAIPLHSRRPRPPRRAARAHGIGIIATTAPCAGPGGLAASAGGGRGRRAGDLDSATTARERVGGEWGGGEPSGSVGVGFFPDRRTSGPSRRQDDFETQRQARRARRGFLGAGDRAPARRPGALAAAFSAPATERRRGLATEARRTRRGFFRRSLF